MCGHGVIAVTTLAIERGLIVPRHGRTNSCSTRRPGRSTRPRRSPMRTASARVTGVSFRNVPSFVLHAGVPVRLGGRDGSGRRRVRRRVLRDRRQRSGRAPDRRGAARRSAPRRHGDQARDRSGVRPSSIRTSRGSTGIYGTIFTGPPAIARRRSAERHDLRRRGSRSIAVRNGHLRRHGRARGDGPAGAGADLRPRKHHRHALHRAASSARL